MTLENRYSNALKLNLLFIFLLCGAYIFYSKNINHQPFNSIRGDGTDYYSYLVSIFIDHNLGHQDLTPWYVINTPSGTINVHTIGLSLLWLPFFLVGYCCAILFNYQLNGYSAPFQIAILIASLVYCMLGLYVFQKVIGLIINNFKIQIVITLCIFFGTNLLFYTANAPSMSHVYSFTFITLFVFLTNKVLVQQKHNYLVLLFIVFAIIILIRPFNVLVLILLPIWSNSFSEFTQQIKNVLSNKKQVIFSILCFVFIISIQSIVWFVQNGKLFQDSYKGNGFYFYNPQTLKFLFGFTSGFFIYTPVCFILLAVGLVKLFKSNKMMFYPAFLFLTTIIYILSSYWAYNFSDSLGMRVMVDYYVLFGILFAYSLKTIQVKTLKYTLYFMTTVTSLFSLVIHYQFLNNIIRTAYMNYDKFSYVFLKTDKSYQNVFGGCNDLEPYLKTKPKQPAFIFAKTDSFKYDSEKEYGVEFRLNQINLHTNKLYLEIEIERTEEISNASSEALFACSIKDSLQKDKFWYAFKMNETPSNADKNNRKYKYSLIIDKKITANDNFVVFIWNAGHQKFVLNKFDVKIYDYNFET